MLARTRNFLGLFLGLLLPSAGLWFAYRWLFKQDTALYVPLVLALVTSWFWAYLIGDGGEDS